MKPQQLELGVAKHPMRVAFEKFDEDNPHVWDLFKQFTFEAIRKGHRAFSIALVTERIVTGKHPVPVVVVSCVVM